MLRTFGDRAHILYLLRIGHNHTLLLTNVAWQEHGCALPAQLVLPFCIGCAGRSLFRPHSTTTHDFIIENARAFCKTFPPKIRNSLSGHFHLTVNSSAFCRAFVIFLSILSAGPVHALLSTPSRRFHRPQGPDAGKSGPGCCHSHPVPTDFQPEEIGCKRKGKAAQDRKSTRLNSSHRHTSRMPSSA